MTQGPSGDRSTRGIPRAIEALIAAVGLVAAFPVIAAAGLLVLATSRGSIVFRQRRVGRGGEPFTLYKLRTMRVASPGPEVTARGDARITPVGRVLRRLKIDELPQLWNVVRGDMALVGPRPEVPRFVDREDPVWREVLTVRPGITDPMTLRLRDEETLLANAPGDPERYYRESLLPAKLLAYTAYLRSRTWRSDLAVLTGTARALLVPARRSAEGVAGSSEIPGPPA